MSGHDPCCLYQDDGYGDICEVCEAIGEARVEERERIAQAIEARVGLRRWADDGRVPVVIRTAVTGHDPLCPWQDGTWPHNRERCACGLIAKARADERERIARAIGREAEQWTGYGYVLIRLTFQTAARIARVGTP